MPQPSTIGAIEALLERLRDRDSVGVFECLDCEGELSFAQKDNCPHCGAPRPRMRLEEHLERLLEQAEPVATDREENPLQRKVEALLKSDKKIRAIKLVRDTTRVGLRDAKELVEHVQAGGHVDDILSRQSAKPPSQSGRQPRFIVTEGSSKFVNVLIVLAILGALLSQIWR